MPRPRGGHYARTVAWLAALSIASGACAAVPDAPVRTDAGYVSGLTVDAGGGRIRVYRGIPYAAPPLGALRWQPPQPVAPWRGVRQTIAYAKASPQYYRPDRTRIAAGAAGMSEDSLYLNVNAPERPGGGRMPVMVLLHAGGLDTGTGGDPLLNAPALPLAGVITVTVNHRLGAFGLFSSPELTEETPHHAAGNYGMLDLVAALRWVKANIAGFGGDPANVTVFGERGGAQKVLWLLASPLAKGLFQRAVVASGTGGALADDNVRTDTQAEADAASAPFIAAMGTRDLARLRAAPWQQVVDAMPSPPPPGGEAHPVADHRMHSAIDAWSLTDHPINIIDEDLGSDVPVLIGADARDAATVADLATEWLPAFGSLKSNVYVYRLARTPGVAYDAAHAGLLERAVGGGDTLRMLVAFARTGDPSVPGLVSWPPFKAARGRDTYVEIGQRPTVEQGYLARFTPSE